MDQLLRTRRRQAAPFACVALLGLALAGADGARATVDLAVGTGLTLLVMALALQGRFRLRGGAWAVGAAFAYLVAVALLRDSSTTHSGAGPLVLLPVFWMALHGTRAQLAAVLAGVAALFAVPIAVLDYPETGARAGTLLILISAVMGLTVQRLVAEACAPARGSARACSSASTTSPIPTR